MYLGVIEKEPALLINNGKEVKESKHWVVSNIKRKYKKTIINLL